MRVYVSAASIWEIAIKGAIGKLDADAATIATALRDSGFQSLAITADPFDRLLIAQALVEPLRLLTADAQLEPYGDLVVRV